MGRPVSAPDPVRESATQAIAEARQALAHDAVGYVPAWASLTDSQRAESVQEAGWWLRATDRAGYSLAGPGDVVVPLAGVVEVLGEALFDADGEHGEGGGRPAYDEIARGVLLPSLVALAADARGEDPADYRVAGPGEVVVRLPQVVEAEPLPDSPVEFEGHSGRVIGRVLMAPPEWREDYQGVWPGPARWLSVAEARDRAASLLATADAVERAATSSAEHTERPAVTGV